MRRSTPHICLILGLAMTLGGCQEVPVAQSRRSAAISWDQLTILHGTAGGRTLLLGMPSRVLPREVTAQAAYRLRLSSSGTTPALAPVRGDPEVLDAVISPDGRRLAAVLVGGTLLLSALDTSPATQAATETAGREVHPGLAFSPNGRRLAFTCGDAPETDICLLDLPTGATRRMTRWHGPDDRPSFSADGRSVIFSSGRSGAAALWSVAVAQGAEPRQLTNIGLNQTEVLTARHTPTPLGPRGAVQVRMNRALLWDGGDGIISVDQLGRHRVVAPDGALVLPALKGDRAVLVRLTETGPSMAEVRP